MNPNELAQNFPQNYVGHGDFGNIDVLENLQKALTAGSGVDAASYTGGRALIPESLENTLVNVLWSQDEARLFQRVKKQPIPSPVHQWDKRTAVGNSDGAWVAEGGTSFEKDQTIARVYETAKYLQTLRKATLQATLSNMIENALTIEQNAGALWIIREVEKALFYGDDDMVTEQPKGIIQQINAAAGNLATYGSYVADNILDIRGASADSSTFEDKMNEGARVIRDSYGKGSLLLVSTMVMQDVQAMLRDRIRFEAGQTRGASVFNQYPTPYGELELLDDIFVSEGAAPGTASALTDAPSAPTEDTAPASGAVAGSEISFWTAADVGAYDYTVRAVNKFGESASLAMTQLAASVAGQKVTMIVADGATTGTAFNLYRSKKGGGSDVRYVKTVARAGATTTISDFNAELPGTSHAFLLTMDAVYDAIEWFQFLPMMKFDLYPTNQAVYPFLMLLFGALALKKSEQHVYIRNISPANLGWF
ncbi:MAG: SU10 major capsid protein [Candidatus Hermodarchaeia archaeon]|jgi:hypothetical protein